MSRLESANRPWTVAVEPTGSLICFVPQVSHGIIDLFHFERMVLHNGTGSMGQVISEDS